MRADPKTYGLHPRLWLLLGIIVLMQISRFSLVLKHTRISMLNPHIYVLGPEGGGGGTPLYGLWPFERKTNDLSKLKYYQSDFKKVVFFRGG